LGVELIAVHERVNQVALIPKAGDQLHDERGDAKAGDGKNGPSAQEDAEIARSHPK
jgi:hypothetical protein